MRLSRPLRAPWDDPSQLAPALCNPRDDAARTGLAGGLLGLVEHRSHANEVLRPTARDQRGRPARVGTGKKHGGAEPIIEMSRIGEVLVGLLVALEGRCELA